MAAKRMFSLSMLDTDAFLEMPCTAQALYFHLCMRADDDGFVGNPKIITRTVGAGEEDLKLLIEKRFVLLFDDGVIVIKHWRMHNTLSVNRYKETVYTEHKAMLRLKPNKAYTLGEGQEIDDSHLVEMGERQSKDEQKTNNRRTIDEQKTNTDKNRIDKKRKEENSLEKNREGECGGKADAFFEDPELNTAFCEYVKFRKKIKAPLTDYAIKMAIIKINNLAAGDTQKAIAIVNQSILRGWRGFFPLEENKKNTKADELNDFYAMAQAWAGGDNVQS